MAGESKHNWGAILGGVAAVIAAISGLIVALRPSPSPPATSPTKAPVAISCKDYQKRPGREWKVACNENTADGLYWKVEQRIGPYGFFGLRAIDGSPTCKGTKDIDSSALTASWKKASSDQGFWVVSRNYCRNFPETQGGDKCNHGNESSEIYDEEECKRSAHCGVYHALCSKVPDE